MSTEAMRRVMQGYCEEVFNKGNPAYDQEHHAPGYVLHTTSHGVKSPPGVFQQGHTTIEDQVAEGDRVVTRWRFEGTVSGEWKTPLGTFTTTDKPITFTWISIERFVDDEHFAESWIEGDFLGIAMQIGVVPSTR